MKKKTIKAKKIRVWLVISCETNRPRDIYLFKPDGYVSACDSVVVSTLTY